MRIVRVGNGREVELPDSWAEAEAMITLAMKYNEGRGSNAPLLSACARIAYAMYSEEFMAADPTQALCYLMQKICRQKGKLGDGVGSDHG
jgi:hypothetical protein